MALQEGVVAALSALVGEGADEAGESVGVGGDCLAGSLRLGRGARALASDEAEGLGGEVVSVPAASAVVEAVAVTGAGVVVPSVEEE